MSHVVIIVQQVVLPPPDAQVAGDELGSMTAEVRYTPPDSATPAQIGNAVERIAKRLARLADSDPPKGLASEK